MVCYNDKAGGYGMKIIVIDGQGGKLGKMLVEQLKRCLDDEIIALGTNSIATSAMLKAGADEGATGENPVIWNAKYADIIIGPIGIIIANALLGEITPAMAQAVSQSSAQKILIPVNKCKNTVIGVKDMSYGDYIKEAVEMLKTFIS